MRFLLPLCLAATLSGCYLDMGSAKEDSAPKSSFSPNDKALSRYLKSLKGDIYECTAPWLEKIAGQEPISFLVVGTEDVSFHVGDKKSGRYSQHSFDLGEEDGEIISIDSFLREESSERHIVRASKHFHVSITGIDPTDDLADRVEQRSWKATFNTKTLRGSFEHVATNSVEEKKHILSNCHKIR